MKLFTSGTIKFITNSFWKFQSHHLRNLIALRTVIVQVKKVVSMRNVRIHVALLILVLKMQNA